MKILLILVFVVCSSICVGQDTDVEVAVKVSNAFNAVAKKAYPCTVVIHNIQDVSKRNRFGFSANPYGNVEKKETNYRAVASGSGFFIREDGYIITNHHVIAGAEYLRVKLKDGTIYDGLKHRGSVKIIGTDEDSDIAVLKVTTNRKFPFLKFANSDKVKIGQWAIAIGAPFSLEYTFTVGVVSQTRRRGFFKGRTFENYIQTDASINSGNSGGSLLNIYGEVIGVNDFIVTDGRARNSAGLGFAIASNLADRISKQLILSGKVQLPWLGIMMKDLTNLERVKYGIAKGVLVVKVVVGEPASLGGILAGDIILAIDDQVCNKIFDVQMIVLKHKAGEDVKILVERQGKILVKTVKTVKRAEDTLNQKDGNSKKVNK